MNMEKKLPLKSQVFEQLKEKIVTCEYLPGAVLHEDMLCQQFNVSRTPIRDALGRLEQEGLVEIKSKKGFRISDISISAINSIYEMRSLIEPYAIENYARLLEDDVYADYVRLFSRPSDSFSGRELFELDGRFHRQFFEVANNAYLQKFQMLIEDQNTRFRVLSARYGRLGDTQSEHLEIASRCLRRDWSGAAGAMRHHIEMSKDAILKYILSADCTPSEILSQSQGGLEE